MSQRHLHLNPPSRAEHIGSLLRPAYLMERRQQFEAKKCSAEELKAAENEAIASIVKIQRDIGIKSITDGEYRRAFFFEGMFEKLNGMTIVPNRPLNDFKAYLPYVQFFYAAGLSHAPSIYCTGKIKRTAGIHTEDFKYLKSLVSPEEVKNLKVTICAPEWMHLRHGSEKTYDLSVYKNDDEYFADLLQAYREEINDLYDLGCRNIQIDDPSFCFFCAESTISGMEKAGVDHEALLSTYIKLYNDMFQGRPNDLTVGVHMCRGNFKGIHYCEGGYARIAVKLFNDLEVDCYYLEYDTERSGNLEPLRHLPLGKVVILGLVTSKSGSLESVDDIRTRVEEAAQIIAEGNPRRSRAEALNQICISPQCGFASVAEGNPLSEEDQRKKLALVVEAAKQIWR